MGLHLLLAAVLLPPLQAPLLPPAQRLHPVPARDVHLAAGSFWGPRVATNLLVSLRHGAEMLEQHGQFGNFRLAAARLGQLPAGTAAPDEYAGVFYYDSDAYKWLEACCLALQQDAPEGTDAAAVAAARADIRARVDRFVEEIAAAQRDDGYIQTQYVVEGWTPFSKLPSDHELYCAGHLIQAAIAHHDATGNRRLLDVALKFAELIDRTFGPDTAAGQRPGCCGHPEIETALVQLFHHTGDQRWLDLASFFLECRGSKLAGGDDYRQDDKPIRDQREARGHAVRQLYLCSGVLGVAAETGDAGLLDANLAIWDDIVRGKLYVTGGLGARADGEAFGAPFELPNERAYSETCASIAWMRWNQELLQATGDAKYADALETTLYNAFLASTSPDGKSFFYVNPLESRGGVHREPWYWCACCPPNVMRTFAGLPGWVASTSEDTLWIHLFDQCVIEATLGNGSKVKVAVLANDADIYPAGTVLVLDGPREGFKLALRVPPYATSISGPGQRGDVRGYRVFSWPIPQGHNEDPVFRAFGDRVGGVFDASAEVELIAADARVIDDVGRVALRRGPLVYAFTSSDPRGTLFDALVDASARPDAEPATWPAATLQVPGAVLGRDEGTELYRPWATSAAAARTFDAAPYFAWADEPDRDMRIWMPVLPQLHDLADDVAFLRERADALVLHAEGCGPVVVSPRLSGRVMTSAFGDREPGFGLVNRKAIEAGPVTSGFANYGGEDRLWLSPEGGPFALFFVPGEEQVAERWSVPGSMDGRARAVKSSRADHVDFVPALVDFHDSAGHMSSVRVERSIDALPRIAVESLLAHSLPASVDVVAFRSSNRLTWADAPPAENLIGLWTLGQFTPSDATTVLFPFRGDAACLKRDYFGVVPDERLQLQLPAGPTAVGLARFTADSRLRSKIGLSRAGATGWIGAWDASRGVLTLVNHTLPPEGAEVPDCDWRVPNPRAAHGDVATSYNDGGEPGFFELESLSAALPRVPGASVEHVSTTIHLGGDRDVMLAIARELLHAEL